jgi:hypothetical protein
MPAGRESKQELLLALKLGCRPADLRNQLRALNSGRSYQGLAEHLADAHGVHVSDTWLWRYLTAGRKSA